VLAELDWASVEKKIVKNIAKSLSYGFVQENYNHSMREAEEYPTKILGPKREEWAQSLAEFFRKLGSAGVTDYVDLLNKIRSDEERMRILQKTGMQPENLVSVLNYLYHWVLPSTHYLTQFIDKENETHKRYVLDLRKIGIRFDLDILEHGRTKGGRENIVERTGIPETFVLEMVHRADIARMPFASGKSVDNYFGGGCDRLDKIAQATQEKLREDMFSYFASVNKKVTDFPVEGIIRCAGALPKVVRS